MSQSSVCASPWFDRNVDVPVASLLRVEAPADVPAALEIAGGFPPRGQSMVVSMVRVTEDGDVSDVRLSVVPNLSRTKLVIKANQVFPEVPEGWVLTLSRDYAQFQFPPDASQSLWIEASSLKVQFWKEFVPGAARRSQVPCSPAEKAQHNLRDFQVRLCVKPSEDPVSADVFMVALPVTKDEINSLKSPELAREGLGYPVVFLSEEPKMMVGPPPAAESDHFGLTCLPVLWMTQTATLPSSVDVLVSTLALWGTATTPRLVAAEEFEQATAFDPVLSALVPAEWRWPFQPDNQSQDDVEGEFLRYFLDWLLCYNSMKFYFWVFGVGARSNFTQSIKKRVSDKQVPKLWFKDWKNLLL